MMVAIYNFMHEFPELFGFATFIFGFVLGVVNGVINS